MGYGRCSMACEFPVQEAFISIIANHGTTGFLHNRILFHPPIPHRLQRQGQHQEVYRQRHVLHRLLRRMHRVPSALDCVTPVFQRRRYQHRHLVPAVRRGDWLPAHMHVRQQEERQ